MADKSCNNSMDLRENVCINVQRVYDCCKDRDCMTDLRVYIPTECQELIDCAVNIRVNSAEVLWTYIDVEALPFNKGFYTVDVKVFFKVTLDVFGGVGRPQRVEGLSSFDKRVILYGSEGSVRTYSSKYVPHGEDIELDTKTNSPIATVEVLDPIALSAKVVDPCEPCGCGQIDLSSVPSCICNCFESSLCDNSNSRRVYVTLGMFSIIRLMREVQILVPSYDFCILEKECEGPTEEDPCGLFYNMDFPVDEFFPPRLSDVSNACECGQKPRNTQPHCGCGR